MCKKIEQEDMEALLEYTASNHIQNMVSFRKISGSCKLPKDIESLKHKYQGRIGMEKRKKNFAKPNVQKSVNFPEATTISDVLGQIHLVYSNI